MRPRYSQTLPIIEVDQATRGEKLCDDYGRKHDCVQGFVKIRRARTTARALQAAKLKFQRLKRTGHWWTHADNIEVNNLDYGLVAIGEKAAAKSVKPIGGSGGR